MEEQYIYEMGKIITPLSKIEDLVDILESLLVERNITGAKILAGSSKRGSNDTLLLKVC